MNLYIIFKFIIFFWHVKDPSHVKVFGQSDRALLETSSLRCQWQSIRNTCVLNLPFYCLKFYWYLVWLSSKESPYL